MGKAPWSVLLPTGHKFRSTKITFPATELNLLAMPFMPFCGGKLNFDQYRENPAAQWLHLCFQKSLWKVIALEVIIALLASAEICVTHQLLLPDFPGKVPF
jgi:hypothetical protein